MPPRRSVRERIAERTGWNEKDSRDLRDEFWKLRRYGATALLGGLLGGGFAAAWGTTTEVGELTFRSHVSVGTGAMLQVVTEAARLRTGLPGEPGVIAEPRDSGDAETINEVMGQFGDVEVIARELATETYRDVLIGAGIGAGVFLASKEAIYGTARFDRRQRIAVGAVVAALSGAPAVLAALPSIEAAGRNWTTVATVFDGVKLNNVDVSGSLATRGVKMLQENEVYYDDLEARVRETLKDVRAEDQERGYDAWLHETDWHCRAGMARVKGAVVEELGIDTVLSTGDLVKGGIDQEDICIDIEADRVYEKVDNVVVSPGNHDGPETIKQLEEAGAEVLEDETFEIDGVLIYGASDPRLTFTGSPQTLRNPDEFISEFEKRINETVPEIEPDILLIHDAENLAEARASSKLTLSGHYHTVKVDTAKNNWIQGGPSGGPNHNQQSYIGPLQTAATLQILYKNPSTDEIEGYRVITMQPNQEVQVGAFTKFRVEPKHKIPPQLVK
jgi:predicted MPP superfamily phosphohydrolase